MSAFPAQSAFFYGLVCRNKFNDSSICDNLSNGNFTKEENIVQASTAQWNTFLRFFSTLPPLVLVFVYGAVSDNISRRLALILPLFGPCIDMICHLIVIHKPTLPLQFFIIGNLANGLTGSWPTFWMAMTSYVSCVTTEENRLKRFGIANSMFYISVTIASFLGGYLVANTSYTFIFSLSLGIYILGIIYIFICIKEVQREVGYYKLLKCNLFEFNTYNTTNVKVCFPLLTV